MKTTCSLTRRFGSLFCAALMGAGLLTLCDTSAHAAGGVPLWTNAYKGPLRLNEGPGGIAVDGSGNVVVIGTTYNGSNHDFAIIAYSNAGVPLWTNRYGGPAQGYDVPVAIAADRSGNVFVTGSSDGNGVDWATIAYSASGQPLWTDRFTGVGTNLWDSPRAIAVDSSGNVFVTGSSESSPFVSDYTTIKYSNAGLPLWTNRYRGPGDGSALANGIAVDSSDNILVTGISSGDYATIKYSNDGLPLWTNRYNGPANQIDTATAITVGSNDNVFVTGSSTAANGYGDYATVAYSNSGVPLWTNRYNGPANSIDDAAAIAVDTAGNVYATGSSVIVRDFVSDPPDYATIKYSKSGVPLWTNRYDGPARFVDNPSGIAVDRSGNVFVTGTSRNSSTFPVSSDYATVAYSSAGQLLWIRRYNRPDNLSSFQQRVAVDRDGNVFVTGYSSASDGFSYYTTIKYSSSIPPTPRLNFEKLNNQLVLRWTNAAFNLQSAPAIAGPFTNVPGVVSPHTNLITDRQQFFRLAQ